MHSRQPDLDSILRIHDALQVPEHDSTLETRLVERHTAEVFPKAQKLLDDYAYVSSSFNRELPGLVYYRVDEVSSIVDVPREEVTSGKVVSDEEETPEQEPTSEEEAVEREPVQKVEITRKEKLMALLTLSQKRSVKDAKQGYGPIRLLVFIENPDGEWEEFTLFTMRDDGVSGMHNVEGNLCSNPQTNEVLSLIERMTTDLKAGRTIPTTPIE